MRTPFHGKFEPFALRSNVIFFHDWRYVHHGDTRWDNPEGQYLGLWSRDPLPSLVWAGRDIPWGIRLRAQPAQKSEPFIRCDRPWEGVLFGSSVIREGGRYRLWYEVVPPNDIAEGTAGERNLLCYAESEDGVNWLKPALGLSAYQGHNETNIVYGGPLTPASGYHGGNVFCDPHAPAEERYKAFHLGFMSKQTAEEYLHKYPGENDPHNERMQRPCGLYGAVSPDGLHWRPLPEPLMLQVSDTQNIAYYDDFLGRYVAYLRTWVMGRRAIGRSESQDFRHFPLPETIIWPDASVGPSDLWYCNGKTVYPGANDYHLLFPKRWHVAQDRFYMHIATSPDGILWGFPPESEILAPGERDAWDAGGVSIACGMVELPKDRVGVAYTGDKVPHKYTRRPPLGEIAWAWWPKGRLVALEAQERGEFRTAQVIFGGNELHLNVRTKQVGGAWIEVVGPDGKALPGRGFEDCDPINGDYLDHVVTWRGEACLGNASGMPLAFRVRLAAAELFSMAFA